MDIIVYEDTNIFGRGQGVLEAALDVDTELTPGWFCYAIERIDELISQSEFLKPTLWYGRKSGDNYIIHVDLERVYDASHQERED